MEAGVNYTKDALTLKLNGYYTFWKDRAQTKYVQVDTSGNGALVFLTGMNSVHMGIEFEGAWQPVRMFRLDMAASFGNWYYDNDVTGTYKNYDNPADPNVEYKYYVKDLKVGDAPQTQVALSASVYPVKGMTAQLVARYNANYYADWDPFSRTDETDRSQVWQVPNYSLFDFHFRYIIPFKVAGVSMNVFAHIFNLTDAEYISDATDESRYNAISTSVPGVEKHSAQRAEVFMGLERTYNVGFGIRL